MIRALLAVAAGVLASACATTGSPQDSVRLSAQMRADPDQFLVVTVSNVQRPLATRAGATLRGYDNAGLYRVTRGALAAVRSLEHDYGLSEVSSWPIAALNVHCIVFRVQVPSSQAALLVKLAHDARVDSAEPLHVFAAQGEPQAQAPDSYAKLQLNLGALAVLEAHQWSRGSGVRVAIVDTGVDFQHPQLRGRVMALRNFVDTDEFSFRADRHGTAVAGVIAAVTDNDRAIVGIAPDARLIALKACWELTDGSGRAVCNSFTLAKALAAALDLSADVVNLSLSGPPDALLARLVERGIERGILYVGAVPSGTAGPSFPADVAGVLPVASAEESAADGRLLLAPGRDILTLVPGGHVDFASGSSLAAAEVSGTVALLLSARPHIAPAEVYRMLERTSQYVATPGGRITSVNACAALEDALQRTGCKTDRSSVATLGGTAPATEAPPAPAATRGNFSH